MSAYQTLKTLDDYSNPKADSEDLERIRKIGSSSRVTIKTIASWLGGGRLLIDVAMERGITPQYLIDYWEKHTTPEFRERTQHTQAEAFWLRGTSTIEKSADDSKSTASSRARAKMKSDVFFNTAKRLHPEKWDKSIANKIARKKIDNKDAPDDSIPYGVDQDLGKPGANSHVIKLMGGVREDFLPRYDDNFEDESFSKAYLVSRITSTRPCPFDKINWKKIMPAYVKPVDTTEEI